MRTVRNNYKEENIERGLTAFCWEALKDRDHAGDTELWSRKGEMKCTYVDLPNQLENV